jgi:hypothetical protein
MGNDVLDDTMGNKPITPEGNLKVQLRACQWQNIGMVEGYIAQAYILAQALSVSWEESEASRKAAAASKADHVLKTNAAKQARALYGLARNASDSAIRTKSKADAEAHVKYTIAESAAWRQKRVMEEHQRILNELHRKIQRLQEDIERLGVIDAKMPLLREDIEACLRETSPMRVISWGVTFPTSPACADGEQARGGFA